MPASCTVRASCTVSSWLTSGTPTCQSRPPSVQSAARTSTTMTLTSEPGPGYGAVHVVVGVATVVLLESLDGGDPAVVTDDDDWLVA